MIYFTLALCEPHQATQSFFSSNSNRKCFERFEVFGAFVISVIPEFSSLRYLMSCSLLSFCERMQFLSKLISDEPKNNKIFLQEAIASECKHFDVLRVIGIPNIESNNQNQEQSLMVTKTNLISLRAACLCIVS